jgi:hypothetical protein
VYKEEDIKQAHDIWRIASIAHSSQILATKRRLKGFTQLAHIGQENGKKREKFGIFFMRYCEYSSKSPILVLHAFRNANVFPQQI